MTAIDRAHLEAQTFGDPELARELLALFAEQCRRLVPSLADAALPAEHRADLAHTLKGSAASVGATAVRALATQIEDALRTRAPAALPLEALAAAVAAVRAEIEGPG